MALAELILYQLMASYWPPKTFKKITISGNYRHTEPNYPNYLNRDSHEYYIQFTKIRLLDYVVKINRLSK